MELAGDIVRYVNILAAAFFIITYARFPWYKSLEGRFLMGYAVVSLISFGFLAWVRYVGKPAFYYEISLIVFGLCAILLIVLNISAYRARHPQEDIQDRRE